MIFVRLLQFVILFWLFYALIRLLGGLVRRRPGPPADKTVDGEEMIQDPECGTFVPRSMAIKEIVEGQTHYFCSTECRDAYRNRH